MAGIFRILVAIVFTAHMILGCCSHHAHAGNNKDCPAPAHGYATAHPQCADSHESGSDHSQHGSQDCQGSKCSVVSATPLVGYSIAQPIKTVVTSLLDNACSPTGISSNQHFFATGRLLIPVHLHLANQVLLI